LTSSKLIKAVYICRNLSKMATSDALSLLSEYGITTIDAIKLKTLPDDDLASLKR
jgi:hypothetical protein